MSNEEQLARYGRSFPPGSILFREGQAGSEMFVIRKGLVSISRRILDAEKVLMTAGPGEFFGEMSLLNRRPRTATARVVEEAHLLVIDSQTFETMLRNNSEIALRMIKKLASRLAEADAQIGSLLLQDSQSRVIHYLSQAAQGRGQAEEGGVRVALQLADLPSMLGLRPNELKEILQKLTRAGIATFQADSFKLIDSAQLRQLKEVLERQEKLGDPT